MKKSHLIHASANAKSEVMVEEKEANASAELGESCSFLRT